MFVKLFIAMFNLSAFTFGGGYVIVPMMRKKFVEELKWIDENEMLDLVAISQSLPGVLAVNASVLVGYRIKGLKGALVSSFGTVLPPLIIISIITLVYDAFRTNMIVAAVLKGMQLGVCALIFTVVVSMFVQLKKDRNIISIIMVITSIFLSLVLKVNTILIIILSIIVGIIVVLWEKKNGVAWFIFSFSTSRII